MAHIVGNLFVDTAEMLKQVRNSMQRELLHTVLEFVRTKMVN
jgi:hypothetical protein